MDAGTANRVLGQVAEEVNTRVGEYDIPATALSQTETDDALADLAALNRHIQAELFNNGDDGVDIRSLFPAQFVKDVKVLMDEWFEPVVDGQSD